MKKIPVMIPFFDQKEEEAAVSAIRSGWVAQGLKVEAFEEAIACHEKKGYGIATSSCTTALHLAMTALGLTKGMDVLVPSFTFVATANSVVQTGATPVLVDVDKKTYNIDPSKIEIKIEKDYLVENKIYKNKKTGNQLWGIVPVHQFGLCADMLEINQIAHKYNLKIVEDAACALGAKIKEVHQGGFGNESCVSFHPRKSITTGEGGMVLTDNKELMRKMKELRSHGTTISAESRHESKGFLLPGFSEAGYNYRMTDIQGAIGVEQVKKLDYILKIRREKAELYNNLLQEVIPEFIIPYVPKDYYHAFQSYVCMLSLEKIKVNSIEDGGIFRDELLSILEERGIATRQGTHAVHMLDYYVNAYGYNREDLPDAYACDRLSITLPLYVQMNEAEQEYVVNTIRECIDRMEVMGEKSE